MLEYFIRIVLRLRGLAIAAAIALTVWGIHLYRTTPREAFPDISPVAVPVFAEAPGLAAEEIETTVVQPIESALGGLPGVTAVKSTSGFGLGVIYLYFRDGTDIYFARQQVAERLRSAESQLPANIPRPELGPVSTGLGQIFIYYLKADPKKFRAATDEERNTKLRELNDFVVKRQLQSVPGVAAVLSMGGFVPQLQIRLNPDAMRRYDVTAGEIADAVRRSNRNVGGQYVQLGAEEYLVRGIGRIETPEELRNLAIREKDGVALKLGSVAEVAYGPELRRGVVTRNGKEEAVAGMVLKLHGANTSRVIEALHRKMESIAPGLPDGVQLIPFYDQADLVDNAGKTVENALMQGIVLVLIVLAFALRSFRPALIVALAMPFCGALAMIGLHLSGMSANLMSLGGIAIALGMLVDGSIVVTENILRRLPPEELTREARINAVAAAAAEVARPISIALLIVIAVFLPLFLLEGVEGKMFQPLAFSIAVALAGSIVAATVNAPALSFWLLRRKEKEQKKRDWSRKLYLPMLGFALRHRAWVFALTAAALGWSLWGIIRIGREFIPTLEEGSVVVTVGMAPSIGLRQSERVVRNLEAIILRHPDVAGTVSRVGRPEAGSHPHPVNFAEIQLELKRRPDGGLHGAAERKKLVSELRRELQEYPGVNLNFSQPIQNAFDELLSGSRAYFTLKLFGENPEILREKAAEIRAAAAKVPGVVDLSVEQSFGQPQLRIELKRDVMAKLGVSADEVMDLIENAVGGETLGAVFRNTRKYDIFMRLDEAFRDSPETLGKLQLRTASGRSVELSQVADLKIAEGPVQINREKLQRRWTVQGNISGRAPSEIVRDIRRAIDQKVKLPPGYFVEFGGQFENQERAMKTLMVVVPIVIGIIFVLLWSAFRSLRTALIVMFNVPLALVGGVAGLYLAHVLLSVPAAVGFIALFGIAMQDAVVMTTDFKELRERGKPLLRAVLEGGVLRCRAVILTTLTTLLGVLPLLLASGVGAEVQKPLAAIVLFGLAGSTLLTLFFLPSLYFEAERRQKQNKGNINEQR